MDFFKLKMQLLLDVVTNILIPTCRYLSSPVLRKTKEKKNPNKYAFQIANRKAKYCPTIVSISDLY